MNALQAALLLSTDSLVAGIGIGVLRLSHRARALVAIAFGICDGIGTLLGGLTMHRGPDAPEALTYAVAAGLVVLAGRGSKAWLCAMPVIFGLDNLAAGNAGGLGPLTAAVGSGAMAGFGILLGAVLRRIRQERTA